MRQSVKLTDAIWLLQLIISSPLIDALGDPSQAHSRIWTWAPAWEADDLPTDLSVPLGGLHLNMIQGLSNKESILLLKGLLLIGLYAHD